MFEFGAGATDYLEICPRVSTRQILITDEEDALIIVSELNIMRSFILLSCTYESVKTKLLLIKEKSKNEDSPAFSTRFLFMRTRAITDSGDYISPINDVSFQFHILIRRSANPPLTTVFPSSIFTTPRCVNAPKCPGFNVPYIWVFFQILRFPFCVPMIKWLSYNYTQTTMV